MQRVVPFPVVPVGCLLAALLGPARASAQAPERERRYVLIVRSLEVARTKASGEPWDVGPASTVPPDLRVSVTRHDPDLLREVAALRKQESERRAELKRRYAPRTEPGARARNRAAERDRAERLRRLLANDQVLRELKEEVTRLERRYRFASPVGDDRFTTRIDADAVEVEIGETVRVVVQDIDVAIDDLIGETEIRITPDLLAQGEIDLRIGQVVSLRVGLRQRR